MPFAIVEVPVHHRPRRAGTSTVRPFHVLSALYGLARIRAARPPAISAPRRAPAATALGREPTALPRRPAG
jgi:hypothetical protein